MLGLLDLSKMCRVCREESDCLLDLFVDSFLPNKEQEPSLAKMLSKCSGCRVDRADGFPQFVCAECALATRGAFRLRQQYRRSMQYFSQLRGMVVEPDDKEETDTSQESSDAMGLIEAEKEAFHGDESNLETLYVELVAGQCPGQESPILQNTKLYDVNNDQSLDSVSVDSSSDEKNTSAIKRIRSDSRSSSDDSWSPSLSKKATKKTRALMRDSSNSGDDTRKKPTKKVKSFQCTHCARFFTQKGNLQTHIRIHTGERPFKCAYCPQTFRQHGHLDVHLRGHTGERPFKCSYCSYSCNQNKTLKNHIKMVHTG
ncbi:hypothetical protein KR038_010942 [Drosophila bunnanda]|nr:hypothetical protein KR038_010942 [Drosophila bunnanda]